MSILRFSKAADANGRGGVSGFVLGLIVTLALFPVFVVSADQARAEAEDFAYAVIAEMKAAERAVNQNSERVRVASLGGGTYSTTRERSSNSRTSERSVDVDRPQVKSKPKRVASLGNTSSDAVEKPQRKSLSGGSVNWTASASCLDSTLRSIVVSLASSFGPVTVNSTCRSPGHNARVGGAPRSKHLSGDAVDFRIHSNASAAYASLRNNGNVGGLKHYGGGLFHIDNGPRRSW